MGKIPVSLALTRKHGMSNQTNWEDTFTNATMLLWYGK